MGEKVKNDGDERKSWKPGNSQHEPAQQHACKHKHRFDLSLSKPPMSRNAYWWDTPTTNDNSGASAKASEQ